MSQAAGNIDIELKLKSGQYTAAMKEAQREAAKFGGGMKTSGHGAVTSVQAVSASLRTMHGGFEQNLRSMERWVAQSKTATNIAQKLFPIVGAGTFAVMIGEIGMKVAEFIDTASKMPKAIELGFGSLLLSSQTSIDSLRLTNDQLENAIAKLEGKRQNNLAIEFDEAAKAADKLAASIESGSNKMNDLLSKNHLSGWAILTGKMGTADREGTLKAFGDQQNSNAYDLADATSRGDKGGIAKAQAALRATQTAELASLRADLSNRQATSHNPGVPNDTANMNIDKGAIAEILKQQQEQVEEVRNANLSATKATLDGDKAAGEAAKKAAHDRVEAMQTGLDAMKLQYGMSIKATYDYWELQKSTELAGGIAYNDIIAKQAQLAVEAASKAHQTIQKAIADAKRSSEDDSTTGPGLINSSNRLMMQQALRSGGDQTQGYIDSNQLAIDQARNEAKEKEARLNDAAGRSMSRYAAAMQLANVHAQEFKTTQVALQSILNARKDAQRTNPSRENDRAVTAAQMSLNNAQVQRGLQITSDANNADPTSTSMSVGFSDAINDFVNASRDGAEQMRSLVTNTLQGLNNQIVNGITGGRTDFKQFGLGVTRNVAGAALEKGEGKIMSALFGGKLGTKGNPMYVKSDDNKASGIGSDISKVGGGIPNVLGKMGGFGSFLGKAGGLLKMALPFLANGGPIAGPAIVGERGPELFIPSSSGQIIPNHQLTTSGSSSGGNIYYSIDATGTDPVQTGQRVRSAIVASHQSAVNQAVKQVHQQSKRQPARR